MIGTATKFPNTSRVISGQVNFVFDSDLILLCNTSLGAVNLLLLEIPENHFNTQYKLYVVDNSNNAVNNNITITAPTGYTIQGSNTAKITSNGGVCIVTISSNKSYSAFFSYNEQGNPLIIKNEGANITPNATSLNFVGSSVEATASGTDVTVTVTSSGNPIAVKNEGTEITPTALSLNFVGNLVNATSVAGAVQIDINSTFLTVTYALLQTLISTNALIPNQNYLITNAIFTSTIPTAYTYTNTANIIVQAITTNEISLSASGIFLNPDFQAIGNYSGVTGFQQQRGVWYAYYGYAIGDVIIWNNLHWKCIVSNSGENPDNFPLNWELLPQTSTNGYITEIDIIKYDVATNLITYREDVRQNRIENNINRVGDEVETFYFYQWGNNNCSNNTISERSLFVCWNSRAIIQYNTFEKNTAVYVSNSTQLSGSIMYNTFSLNSSFNLANENGQFNNNVIINNSASITNSSSFENNILKNCNGSINNSSYFANNTFEKQLNFSMGLNIVNQNSMQNNQFIDFNSFQILNRYEDGQNGYFWDNVGTQNCKVFINNCLGEIKNNIFTNCDVRLYNIFLGKFNDNQITGGDFTGDNNSVLLGDTDDYNIIFTDNVLINSFVALYKPSDEFMRNNLQNSTFKTNCYTQKIISNNFRSFNFQLFFYNSQPNCPSIRNTVIYDVTTNIEEKLFDDIYGGICQYGINTLKTSLNMDDALIYDVPSKSLTIPTYFKTLFGEYSLKSNTPFDIETINNLNDNFATKFTNEANYYFPNNEKRFVVLPSVPNLTYNQLLSPNIPLANLPYYFYLGANSGSEGYYDSIYIRSLGNYNGIEQYYHYTWTA